MSQGVPQWLERPHGPARDGRDTAGNHSPPPCSALSINWLITRSLPLNLALQPFVSHTARPTCAMEPDSADATSTPLAALDEYLSRRNDEYQALRRAWLHQTDGHPNASSTCPASRCMITRLPAELLLMILDPLYQADLFHLALACRRLAGPTIDLLYRRDVARFDCLALRWACTFGLVPTLERALNYGASPNHVFGPDSHWGCGWLPGAPAHPDFCRTPLLTAVFTSEPEIVGRLLAHGADPSGADPRITERPPLNRRSVIPALYPINLAIGTPDLPHCASFRPGHPPIVRQLLDAGANPNQYSRSLRPHLHRPCYMGFTPLLMAMRGCVPVETVRLLLERGARATAVGSFEGLTIAGGAAPGRNRMARERAPGQLWDRTPLGAVLRWSGRSDIYPLDLDKIRLLLAHGSAKELAWLKDLSRSGPSHPLPMLCRYWSHDRVVEILKLFVAAGADIASWADMVIPPTLSVLWWAECLIPRSRGEEADPKAEAVIVKVSEIITVLAEATLASGQCPGRIRKSTIIDAVVSRRGFDLPDLRVEQTALRYVCTPYSSRGLITFIPVLLSCGADMNNPDPNGRTALHYAAMFCFQGLRIGKLLQFLGGPAASGLVIDAVDDRGWTPLHFACLLGFWSEPYGQVTATRALLDHGANVRKRTTSGWTPLALAVLCANLDLVNLLLDKGAQADDLSRSRGDETLPTPPQIGRIVFVGDREAGWPTTPVQQVAAQLADTTHSVAVLLAERLGILMPSAPPPPLPPLPPLLPLPPPPGPPKVRNLSPAPDGPRGAWQYMEFVDPPFGVAWMGSANYAAADFEEHVEQAFGKLAELGLTAWLVPIRPWEGVKMKWEGAGPQERSP